MPKPKKYIIRNFKPGQKQHNKITDLISLSALGFNTDSNIVKSSLALGVSETTDNTVENSYMGINDAVSPNRFNRYKDITKNQSSSYAFFDMSYPQRRDYLRQFACDNEINFILDTITNESIISDENGYFAMLDLDRLKLHLNKSYNDKRA